MGLDGHLWMGWEKIREHLILSWVGRYSFANLIWFSKWFQKVLLELFLNIKILCGKVQKQLSPKWDVSLEWPTTTTSQIGHHLKYSFYVVENQVYTQVVSQAGPCGRGPRQSKPSQSQSNLEPGAEVSLSQTALEPRSRLLLQPLPPFACWEHFTWNLIIIECYKWSLWPWDDLIGEKFVGLKCTVHPTDIL